MSWAGVPNKLEFWSDNDRTGVENVTVAVHLFTGPENGKVKKSCPQIVTFQLSCCMSWVELVDFYRCTGCQKHSSNHCKEP